MTPTVTSLRDIAVPAYGPTILASTATGATLPVMALTARDLGACVGMAAFVVALLGLGQLAGDLPAGALVHRSGERAALLIACGAVALGACLNCNSRGGQAAACAWPTTVLQVEHRIRSLIWKTMVAL